MKCVIDAGVALKIVGRGGVWRGEYQLLAPVLLRSLVLTTLYEASRGSAGAEDEALEINRVFGRLKIRYLGDAVLRRRAWTVAAELGLPNTFDAEFIALTHLQADALITDDKGLSKMARRQVEVMPSTVLFA